MNAPWRKNGVLREGEPEGGGEPKADDTVPPVKDTKPPKVEGKKPGESDGEFRSRVENELARLKQALASGHEPPPAKPQGQPPSRDELEKQFWDNPLGMAYAIAQKTVQDAQKVAHQGDEHSRSTLREVAKAQARNRNDTTRKLFDKYEADIEAKMKLVDGSYHTSVDVWRNAYTSVVGEHLEEIQNDKTLFKPEDGPGSPSPATPPSKEFQMTDQHKQAAKLFGLTDEEFKDGRRIYEDQDAEWEKHFVFDTRKARRAARAKKAATA